MGSLSGARVALLEGRMTGELANLVRRHGGEPYSVPAVREAALAAREQVGSFLDGLTAGAFPVVVFLTGAGATALLQEADRLGRLPELLAGLRCATVVCRGPKPTAVLTRHDVPVAVRAAAPYTSVQLLEAMAVLDLTGTGVGLVHYGEQNAPLAEALRRRGARLEELCLYEWLLPEDLRPLQTLVGDLLAGTVDAIAFTSQVQARHLFLVASGLGLDIELARALNARLVVASVGPTCTAALEALGVRPHVVPAQPKMGHLITALADHMGRHERRDGGQGSQERGTDATTEVKAEATASV